MACKESPLIVQHGSVSIYIFRQRSYTILTRLLIIRPTPRPAVGALSDNAIRPAVCLFKRLK